MPCPILMEGVGGVGLNGLVDLVFVQSDLQLHWVCSYEIY